MILVISGSRHLKDYDCFKKCIDRRLAGTHIELVITGGAHGVDEMGKRWALEGGFPHQEVAAEWSKYRRAAGPIRNKAMIQMADTLFCYWDGESKGSAGIISLAKKAKRRVLNQFVHVLWLSRGGTSCWLQKTPPSGIRVEATSVEEANEIGRSIAKDFRPIPSNFVRLMEAEKIEQSGINWTEWGQTSLF